MQTQGIFSGQQINQYLTHELTARARIDSAKAQLDAQLLRLKHTQVLAPDAGTITARNATVGSVLPAGMEMFRLIRQGRLEWRAELTANELARVSVGNSVVVSLQGGEQRKGRVRVVSPTVDAQSRNGIVYVDLLGANASGREGSFKPGMFARGEFELGSSNAMTLVQTAVVVRDGFSFVARVGADNRVNQVKVRTGRMMGDQIEILSGLNANDRVVTSGAGFLSDGDLVKVVAAPAPTPAPTTAAPSMPAPANAAKPAAANTPSGSSASK
jgi:HlyD family secretion protein